MLARFFAIASIAALAVAGPVARGGIQNGANGGKCNTGTMHCCDGHMSNEGYTNMVKSGAVVGIVADPLKFVGLQCAGVGLLGNQGCKGQTFCCEGNKQTGLVNIQCMNVDL